jgi:hypothetical protein
MKTGAAEIEFEFSSEFAIAEDATPIFLRHSGIYGRLRLSGKAAAADRVKIVLTGWLYLDALDETHAK